MGKQLAFDIDDGDDGDVGSGGDSGGDSVGDSVGDENACPVCGRRLRCETRGSSFFAWCAGPAEGWGMGCSGVSAFADDKTGAINTARSDFLNRCL